MLKNLKSANSPIETEKGKDKSAKYKIERADIHVPNIICPVFDNPSNGAVMAIITPIVEIIKNNAPRTYLYVTVFTLVLRF